MRGWYIIGAAVIALGCAGTQHFDATERATATSPRGDLAAEYEVTGAQGQIAEAKVWLRGAYEDRVDGAEMTVIEVVFDVDNEGRAPVALSDVRIDSMTADGVGFDDVAPFRVEGDRVVAPGGEGRLHAYFAIPQRFDPEDIARLEVGWALRHAEGTYAQRTPFRQVPEYYAYGYPYYAPFVYDPFYYPFGWPV